MLVLLLVLMLLRAPVAVALGAPALVWLGVQGLPAGVADRAGAYPPGTVNHVVMSRLAAFAHAGARRAAEVALRRHDLA